MNAHRSSRTAKLFAHRSFHRFAAYACHLHAADQHCNNAAVRLVTYTSQRTAHYSASHAVNLVPVMAKRKGFGPLGIEPRLFRIALQCRSNAEFSGLTTDTTSAHVVAGYQPCIASLYFYEELIAGFPSLRHSCSSGSSGSSSSTTGSATPHFFSASAIASPSVNNRNA